MGALGVVQTQRPGQGVQDLDRDVGLPALLEPAVVVRRQAGQHREVDGGLQSIRVGLPAVVTVDLRMNEPRYASLPNIMKAKKKPLEEKAPADYGVDVTPRLQVVSTREPKGRAAGTVLKTVDELVDRLKDLGVVS